MRRYFWMAWCAVFAVWSFVWAVRYAWRGDDFWMWSCALCMVVQVKWCMDWRARR